MMKKRLLNILKILLALYIAFCGLLYIFQEKLIFFPQKLEKDYHFDFKPEFEEINIKSTDGKLINGLLFKVDSSKGLIFYLHGNAGSLSSWGNVAKTYTDLNYDIYIVAPYEVGSSKRNIKISFPNLDKN